MPHLMCEPFAKSLDLRKKVCDHDQCQTLLTNCNIEITLITFLRILRQNCYLLFFWK